MWNHYFNLILQLDRCINIDLHGNLYSPAVTVQVIFKVDFTTLIHYRRFWMLAPYFNKTPVVLQYKNSITWKPMVWVSFNISRCLYYLKEKSSEDSHVVPEYAASIRDAATSSVQQLSGVKASLFAVWRHHQVTLVLWLVRSISMGRTSANLGKDKRPFPVPR